MTYVCPCPDARWACVGGGGNTGPARSRDNVSVCPALTWIRLIRRAPRQIISTSLHHIGIAWCRWTYNSWICWIRQQYYIQLNYFVSFNHFEFQCNSNKATDILTVATSNLKPMLKWLKKDNVMLLNKTKTVNQIH